MLMFQVYTIPVTPMSKGSMYVRVSPAKVFGKKPTKDPLGEVGNHIIHNKSVIMLKCDSTLKNSQHWVFYGCYVPYFKINADIVSDGVAYYMEWADYINDLETLKNLTE